MSKSDGRKPFYMVTPFPIEPSEAKEESSVPLPEQSKGVWFSHEKVKKINTLLQEARILNVRYQKLKSNYQRLSDQIKQHPVSVKLNITEPDVIRLREILTELKQFKCAKPSRLPQLIKEMETILEEKCDV